MKNKKAQEGAIGAIITLIVGVAIATLIMIFTGALGGQTYNLVEDDIDEIGAVSVTDENDTYITNTLVTLDNTDIISNTFVLYSGSTQVSSNDYVLFASTGKVNYTGTTYNNSQLNASYDYKTTNDIRTSVKSGITSAFDAQEQTGNYLPLIVLAVVIFLVLSLVLGFTALGGGRMGGTAL